MTTTLPIRGLLMLISFVVFSPCMVGQLYVEIYNGSFEDEPRAGGVMTPLPIVGWFDCGRKEFPFHTPPDIHPHEDAWQVTLSPYDGETYLGLVVREDGSYESVGQTLGSFLESGHCYKVSVWLARSSTYFGLRSPIGMTDSVVYSRDFTTPAIFQIVGGKRSCSRAEVLAESPPVEHEKWAEYNFIIRPEKQIKSIFIRAYYDPDRSNDYDGHILVDKLSNIREITCN